MGSVGGNDVSFGRGNSVGSGGNNSKGFAGEVGIGFVDMGSGSNNGMGSGIEVAADDNPEDGVVCLGTLLSTAISLDFF